MSELERAAAEHARAQVERARVEAIAEQEAQEAAAFHSQRVRAAAREFFEIATRHGAPQFRLCQEHFTEEKRYWYTRTKHRCVVALLLHEGLRDPLDSWMRWAVTADGAYFDEVSVRPYLYQELRKLTGDERGVTLPWPEERSDGYDYLEGIRNEADADRYLNDFIAAASAVMAPVEVPGGSRTGVQPGGWIVYRL